MSGRKQIAQISPFQMFVRAPHAPLDGCTYLPYLNPPVHTGEEISPDGQTHDLGETIWILYLLWNTGLKILPHTVVGGLWEYANII